MKPYARELKSGHVENFFTTPHPQQQWKPSSDRDKTEGLHSRKRYKQEIRNIKRSQNKTARQRLKLELLSEL